MKFTHQMRKEISKMVNTDLLKETIKDRGIPVTKLSEKVGVDRATLYNQCKGKGEFTASEIVKLTAALRLTNEERDNIFLLNEVN